jgi:DTW domain-containing protein YfiP
VKIFLLTHERELNRKSNTGNIAIERSQGIVERVIWDRVNPDKKIVTLLEQNDTLLLYPTAEEPSESIEDFGNIIIIDATWQEAQKIYNRSPYLKFAPKATLSPKHQSKFKLRRNQRESGLCTIECIIELLRINKQQKLADDLARDFEFFNST